MSYLVSGKIPKLPTMLRLVDLSIFQNNVIKWLDVNGHNFDIFQISGILYDLSKFIIHKLHKPVVIRLPGPPTGRRELPHAIKLSHHKMIRFVGFGEAFQFCTDKGIPIIELPHGIETGRFKREKNTVRESLGLNEQCIVLLWVGRLVGVKGIDFLIESFVKAYKTNRELRLIIVGDGPLKNRLKKNIHSKKIRNIVKPVGAIPFRDIYKYYATADIFIHTSIYENVCNAVMEAMASSLPVICTETGYLPNLIRKNRNGLLIKYGDVEALTNAIVTLSTDSYLRTRFGNENRKTILTRFTWEKASLILSKVYKSLLN
jgi:glycosyltransferase involved in cell wall biosynthesis